MDCVFVAMRPAATPHPKAHILAVDWPTVPEPAAPERASEAPVKSDAIATWVNEGGAGEEVAR